MYVCTHTHTHTHTHYTGPQAPKKAVCVITGLPAKYRDPKTGQPYATIEAFRKIREKDEKGK